MALKHKLDYHYRYFDFSQISPDPLEFPHRYDNFYDREISAFVSSVFAYGNVKQILKTLEKIHTVMGDDPYRFVLEMGESEKNELGKIIHRFFTGNDIVSFFETMQKVYKNYGSLKYLFLLYYFEKDKNLKNSLSFFSNNLLRLTAGKSEPSGGVKFMFPDPFKGSACKRMNLFLRWMIRKDELDFGLWPEVDKSKLVIPVDTHIARICTFLGLTKRKNVSWLMAEEITEKLKEFDRDDPVKYDFAICHIGMRKMEF